MKIIKHHNANMIIITLLKGEHLQLWYSSIYIMSSSMVRSDYCQEAKDSTNDDKCTPSRRRWIFVFLSCPRVEVGFAD